MELRKILYGYKFSDGKYIPNDAESTFVVEIFRKYIEGETMDSIAKYLTESDAVYFNGKCEWDKSRVARILENANYVGNNDYEPIISEDLFEFVKEIRGLKSGVRTEPSIEIKLIKPKFFCRNCGKNMIRNSSGRWRCSDGCTFQNVFKDDLIIDSVVKKQNFIIDNPDIIKNDSYDIKRRYSVIKEFDDLITSKIHSGTFENEEMVNLILSSANKKYKVCYYSNSQSLDDSIGDYLNKINSENFINTDFLAKLVRKIYALSTGEIIFQLINGKVV